MSWFSVVISVLAFAAAVGLGALIIEVSLKRLREYMKLPKNDPDPETRGVPGWLTGVVERSVFTLFVTFAGAQVATAMIGWIALKMATNWNRSVGETDPAVVTRRIRLGLSALLADLVSMAIAFLAGLLIRWLLKIGP